MPELHSCKLGTIPAEVQLFRAYRLRPGLKVKYRKEGDYTWTVGWIYEVHENGYFKMVKQKEIAMELIKERRDISSKPND